MIGAREVDVEGDRTEVSPMPFPTVERETLGTETGVDEVLLDRDVTHQSSSRHALR